MMKQHGRHDVGNGPCLSSVLAAAALVKSSSSETEFWGTPRAALWLLLAEDPPSNLAARHPLTT